MLLDLEKLKRIQQERGLSWNELARRAGIRGPSLHAIIHGKTRVVKSTTLVGLANALGVPMQELLKGRSGKPSKSLDNEAMALYSQLDERDKMAILAAIRSLSSPKKP